MSSVRFNPQQKPRHKERHEVKKAVKKRVVADVAEQVKKRDGRKCQNPECPNHGYPTYPAKLESAHTTPKSIAGPTAVNWEITLCSYPCHYWADEGKEEKDRMVSGPEYMLRILKSFIGKPNDRWAEARKELSSRMGIRRGKE